MGAICVETHTTAENTAIKRLARVERDEHFEALVIETAELGSPVDDAQHHGCTVHLSDVACTVPVLVRALLLYKCPFTDGLDLGPIRAAPVLRRHSRKARPDLAAGERLVRVRVAELRSVVQTQLHARVNTAIKRYARDRSDDLSATITIVYPCLWECHVQESHHLFVHMRSARR